MLCGGILIEGAENGIRISQSAHCLQLNVTAIKLSYKKTCCTINCQEVMTVPVELCDQNRLITQSIYIFPAVLPPAGNIFDQQVFAV
jgi:hypothetical protein